jgi:hypothetical protein
VSSRTVTLLAIGVVVLFAAVFLMNQNGDDRSTESGLLLPELEETINDIDTVTITGAEGTVTVSNEGGRWVVPEKHGYPADTATLRSLLLALADARKIEQKTANPELYGHLGVGDPADEEGGGVLVKATQTDGAEPVAVILGDPAQGDYRYARLPDKEASWLIDRNPDVPDSAGEWLLQEIIDIPPSDIRSAEVRHADGEIIRIMKQSAEETNFRVADIPEGRELSYPSVANGTAGVLSDLRLEDVRPAAAGGGEPAATVSLATFDGLEIDLDVWREDSSAEETGDEGTAAATWIALEASASERSETPATPEDASQTAGGAEVTSEADEAPGEAAGGAEGEDGDVGDPAAGEEEAETDADDAPAEASRPDPEEQAAAINERVRGWQYRVPDYKARQLTRRWDDLLKDEE